jgi:hypothetical protein
MLPLVLLRSRLLAMMNLPPVPTSMPHPPQLTTTQLDTTELFPSTFVPKTPEPPVETITQF